MFSGVRIFRDFIVVFGSKCIFMPFHFRLLCQILFFVCDIFIRNGAVSSTLSLSDITPDVWAVGLAAPVLFVIVNELVKHREIK